MADDIEKKRARWRKNANAWRATPEGRQSTRAANLRYEKTDKGRAARSRVGIKRRKKPSVIAARRAGYQRLRTDPKWKAQRAAAFKKYRSSAKVKSAALRKYELEIEWSRFVAMLKSKNKGRPQLTLDEYHSKYESQDFACDICGSEIFPLHVDHCHVSGKFRGLLCNSCNNGLGRFRDNPARLKTAALYLEKYQNG